MRVIETLIIFLIFISFAEADIFKSRINSIDEGRGDQAHLIMFENGRVVFLDKLQREKIVYFKGIHEKKKMIEIVSDETNGLIRSKIIQNQDQDFETVVNSDNSSSFLFDPTLVSVLDSQNIFNRMRRDYQNDSQCYNRAHIWANEEFTKTALNSIKHFLFFTNSYIRRYRYHWWFHVAPSVLVKNANGVTEKVLDRRYSSGPLDVKTWTDIFVYSKRQCSKISKYSDYENNQEKEDCYLIPVSMYFWQPRDIENRDQTGIFKTKFYESEIKWSYYEAF